MSFHRFALAAGADAVANWHAHFLRNLIVGGSVDDEIFEPDLVAFYEILLSAQLTRRWPTDDELPAVLGAFRPLLATAGWSAEFADALDTYCDFRLSRAFQFEDGNAKKPRRPSDPMFVFEAQWLALFPFELFSLRGVYRAIAGADLDLAVDHPLMKTPLTSVPALGPLARDAFIDQLQAYGRRRFGTQWRPLTPAPLIDDDR